ncbi:endonuclease/exonuclease/phosphatase family protein [Plasmodium brasilianum]|uniref:Exodeoxyribonuclease III, putative n=2 Tax=Plasmodium (Plasmodium) TaxID=418103 RepID=A0A1D3TCN5_PLAMA|nr:exodeoxyribonuclease III, putative [Plasmodium malariae]KAI4835715.1 endonuclease/exonuclease/phosphatase family protein [Plasmodium brasilianum]SCP02648.1 exodeoxyribonuclease III, putative [Plasmodium malariae]
MEKIQIASWNVNGWKKSCELIKKKNGNLFEFLKKLNIDILCIQETKTNDSIIENEFNLLEAYSDKYESYWNNCKKKNEGHKTYKGYSGIATYVCNANKIICSTNNAFENFSFFIDEDISRYDLLIRREFPLDGSSLSFFIAGNEHGIPECLSGSTNERGDSEETEKVREMKEVNGQEGMQDMQSVQNMQDMQNTQDMQNLQDMQNTQDMQNMQDMQNLQDMQNIQSMKKRKTDEGTSSSSVQGTRSRSSTQTGINCPLKSVQDFFNEGRILVTMHKHFIIVNIYAPYSGCNYDRLSYKMMFMHAVRAKIIQLRITTGLPIILLGDLNISYRNRDVYYLNNIINLESMMKNLKKIKLKENLSNKICQQLPIIFDTLKNKKNFIIKKKMLTQNSESYSFFLNFNGDIKKIGSNAFSSQEEIYFFFSLDEMYVDDKYVDYPHEYFFYLNSCVDSDTLSSGALGSISPCNDSSDAQGGSSSSAVEEEICKKGTTFKGVNCKNADPPSICRCEQCSLNHVDDLTYRDAPYIGNNHSYSHSNCNDVKPFKRMKTDEYTPNSTTEKSEELKNQFESFFSDNKHVMNRIIKNENNEIEEEYLLKNAQNITYYYNDKLKCKIKGSTKILCKYTYKNCSTGKYLVKGKNCLYLKHLNDIFLSLGIILSDDDMLSIANAVGCSSSPQCCTNFLKNLIYEDKMIDTFSFFYPNINGKFTCWDTYKQYRVTNEGSRIDYIFIDYILYEYFIKSYRHLYESPVVLNEHLKCLLLPEGERSGVLIREGYRSRSDKSGGDRIGGDRNEDDSSGGGNDDKLSYESINSPTNNRNYANYFDKLKKKKAYTVREDVIHSEEDDMYDFQFKILSFIGLIYTTPKLSDHIAVNCTFINPKEVMNEGKKKKKNFGICCSDNTISLRAFCLSTYQYMACLPLYLINSSLFSLCSYTFLTHIHAHNKPCHNIIKTQPHKKTKKITQFFTLIKKKEEKKK